MEQLFMLFESLMFYSLLQIFLNSIISQKYAVIPPVQVRLSNFYLMVGHTGLALRCHSIGAEHQASTQQKNSLKEEN